MSKEELVWYVDALEQQMQVAAQNLQFEEAARLRDEIKRLKSSRA